MSLDYWEVARMRLPSSWITERLIIRNTIPEDSEALKQICVSWKDKILVEGEAFSEGFIEECIRKGDVPPIENADAANSYMLTIQDVNNKIIGFFNLYHGYPDKDTLWISMFVIDAEFHGCGLGQEVISSLSLEGKKRGWKAIGLGVYLKNWKGIRFWFHNGFNSITGIYGDKEYSENSFSLMVLRKEL